MPSDTSLPGLGCGKHPTTARTCDKGGELMLVVGSRRRADEPQFLVPAALEGRALSISDSRMKVIFGRWRHGLFHSFLSLLSSLPNLNLLHFILSMTNLPRYFCRVGPGKQQVDDWRYFPDLELWSHPLVKKCEKIDLWRLATCTHAFKNDKEGIWKIWFSIITVLSLKVLCTHLPKAGIAFPYVFVPLSAFNSIISSASCICEPISEKNPCQTSLYILVSIVL